ncbi:hypothetical protein Tdes44962_MAKER08106 [Teratosphaeria destructans]|uniref:Uncharacterized protein n=1 Tax=Teratosphaeria destructans TaxID=418781 RepID=A0A9W7SX50_9PEZI|nr:hypothetical protein Tdes44962_MAKER08106 [Teratosphaeria destructans]
MESTASVGEMVRRKARVGRRERMVGGLVWKREGVTTTTTRRDYRCLDFPRNAATVTDLAGAPGRVCRETCNGGSSLAESGGCEELPGASRLWHQIDGSHGWMETKDAEGIGQAQYFVHHSNKFSMVRSASHSSTRRTGPQKARFSRTPPAFGVGPADGGADGEADDQGVVVDLGEGAVGGDSGLEVGDAVVGGSGGGCGGCRGGVGWGCYGVEGG